MAFGFKNKLERIATRSRDPPVFAVDAKVILRSLSDVCIPSREASPSAASQDRGEKDYFVIPTIAFGRPIMPFATTGTSTLRNILFLSFCPSSSLV